MDRTGRRGTHGTHRHKDNNRSSLSVPWASGCVLCVHFDSSGSKILTTVISVIGLWTHLLVGWEEVAKKLVEASQGTYSYGHFMLLCVAQGQIW